MDLRKLRTDLGTVATEAGFTAWDYYPDDVQNLPAAVVGGIAGMVRLNRLVTEIDIGITFYCSLADPADAAARLDLALSTNMDGSFLDAVDEITPTDAVNWRSVTFVRAGPYNRYDMPGNTHALGCEIVLRFTA